MSLITHPTMHTRRLYHNLCALQELETGVYIYQDRELQQTRTYSLSSLIEHVEIFSRRYFAEPHVNRVSRWYGVLSCMILEHLHEKRAEQHRCVFLHEPLKDKLLRIFFHFLSYRIEPFLQNFGGTPQAVLDQTHPHLLSFQAKRERVIPKFASFHERLPEQVRGLLPRCFLGTGGE